ncbi:hypothetical protein Geu3261_0259_002 [Komagataeibacter europaeus NBRC 3261]|uniref:Uncharacterized protein n=1 Tax=Komagataeibacter europaeus NBRC 3261 TaxID=1234669 RepID=A0A0D6Q4W5_KOMEU|nr:hypothetical protein Geu3261_0259_002 [Komagataeibacter europaeus NBRC 3261]
MESCKLEAVGIASSRALSCTCVAAGLGVGKSTLGYVNGGLLSDRVGARAACHVDAAAAPQAAGLP